MLKRRKGAESALIFIEFYRHLHKHKGRMEALQRILGWIFVFSLKTIWVEFFSFLLRIFGWIFFFSLKNIWVDLLPFFKEYFGGSFSLFSKKMWVDLFLCIIRTNICFLPLRFHFKVSSKYLKCNQFLHKEIKRQA